MTSGHQGPITVCTLPASPGHLGLPLVRLPEDPPSSYWGAAYIVKKMQL